MSEQNESADEELSPELKRVFRIVLVVAMTLFGFIAVEIGAFVLEGAGSLPMRILPEEKLNYKVDIYARHRFEHDSRLARLADGREFPMNALGLRGPETTIDKAPNTLRVMIYGGSHVFDQNVSGHSDWPRLVEKHLHDSGFTNVEVLNLGTPGHATTDAVGRLLTEGHRFEPDIVLLDNGWNDLKYFASDELLNRQQRPFTESYRTQYYNGLDRLLCRWSRVYLAGRWAAQAAMNRLVLYGVVAGPEGLYEEREPVKALLESGPQQYELNVRTFVSIAKSIGATPVLVKQPALIDVGNTPEEKAMIHYHYVNMDHETLCEANTRVRAILDQVGQETGTPVIDAASFVEPSAENFTDAVHTTEMGSKRIAEVVANGLLGVLSGNDPEPATIEPPSEAPPSP